MQAVVDGHHALVRRAAKQVIDGLLADYARRRARYEEAAQLRARGVSISRRSARNRAEGDPALASPGNTWNSAGPKGASMQPSFGLNLYNEVFAAGRRQYAPGLGGGARRTRIHTQSRERLRVPFGSRRPPTGGHACYWPILKP
jgi:hypothetical protein